MGAAKEFGPRAQKPLQDHVCIRLEAAEFCAGGQGTLADQQLEAAQSKTSSALKRSQISAFELFKTNLEQDQILRRKYISATSGDESRA